jgi:D-alanine-D-alanine ligase
MKPPFVVKPTHEGSTIGLHIVREASQWHHAREATARDGREAMVERFIEGRELTIGMIDRGEGLVCLPTIEITPSEGLYDYNAKYERDDTVYTVDPDVPDGVTGEMRAMCEAITSRIGVRDLCRVDFILDDDGVAWFLELNTMPGFTSHSLVPMACADLGIIGLCKLLVDRAVARANTTTRSV